MFDRDSLYRIAPFGAYIFFMILEDGLLKFGWEANDLRLLYAVKITIVAGLLWWMRKAYRELRWPAGENFGTWSAAVIAGILVFIAWINLTEEWMVMGEPVGFDPRNHAEIDWLLVTVRLIGAVLVVPVMEELFWRSFLMRWLIHPDFLTVNPAQVGLKAFCITAMLFAVAHNLWLAGLFAGIVYNLLYMRSGTLWSPILAHALTNGMLGIWIISTDNWGFW
ncbi:CAAX prenyl protease-related protein [Nitrosomonas sp. Nm166]|uniref:CAAX prenyl protease-related protein n=1 Tax=Nitrosomonas sp. Nm166 TaxID=1881054 RepID=UPI0008E947FB|nr:CAAX prenyl protease-related protein [Nitrosomonas sp. Nm166]SFE24013.1 hypothetical protein SAMN05428977_101058 [Nitrosomonas sp. Nm166]